MTRQYAVLGSLVLSSLGASVFGARQRSAFDLLNVSSFKHVGAGKVPTENERASLKLTKEMEAHTGIRKNKLAGDFFSKGARESSASDRDGSIKIFDKRGYVLQDRLDVSEFLFCPQKMLVSQVYPKIPIFGILTVQAVLLILAISTFHAAYMWVKTIKFDESPPTSVDNAESDPEDCSPSGHPESQQFCSKVAQMKFDTWFDLLSKDPEAPFIRDVGQGCRAPMSYAQLHEFAYSTEMEVSRFGIGLTDRVCTMIPNGPEAASCAMVLPLRCVYAPLNPALSKGEVEFEFEDLPCHTLIVMRGENSCIGLKVAESRGVEALMMESNSAVAGLFTLHQCVETSLKHPGFADRALNSRQDLALVVHTSGTTKKPKIVPLTQENLVTGALCVKSTLKLQPTDVCLNLMPLYHMHGLAVNVLVTGLSGSSVICSPGYRNPVDSMTWVGREQVSWYSAVPTMHQGLVEHGEAMRRAGEQIPENIVLARNCSAALVPVIARRLSNLFRCEVLPTYAMSESVPIASNPRHPRLIRLRSVGLAAGPRIELRTEQNLVPPPGVEAEVCVFGECVTKGYERRPHQSEDPNTEAFTSDGWLRTGDKGYLDKFGYLCLSGRFKEIINRGGEKISPFEVENVLRQHAGILDCIAFAAPHVQLGETVGAAVVARPKGLIMSPTALEALREFVEQGGQISMKWAPACLVFVSEIPTGSTGKPARISFAKNVGLPIIDASQSEAASVWNQAKVGCPLVPILDEAGAALQPAITADSLGVIRAVGGEGEERLLQSLAAVGTFFVTLSHMGNNFVEHAPNMHRFLHANARSEAPTMLLLLCLAYQESTQLHFQLGRRDVIMFFAAMLYWLVPQVFRVLWHLLTNMELPATEVHDERLVLETNWFLYFVVLSRLMHALCHSIGVNRHVQAVGAFLLSLASIYTWKGTCNDPWMCLGPRLHPVSSLYLFAVYTSSVLYLPDILTHMKSLSDLLGPVLMKIARAVAISWLIISPQYVLGMVTDGCVCWLLEDSVTWVHMLRNILATLAHDILWVTACLIVVSPGNIVLQTLGKCTFGAYMLHHNCRAIIFETGLSIYGFQLVPPFPSVAKYVTVGWLQDIVVIAYTVVIVLLCGFVFNMILAMSRTIRPCAMSLYNYIWSSRSDLSFPSKCRG